MRLALIVLIWLGAAASTPVSRKLQPVNDTVSAAPVKTASLANSTHHHKGKIEIQSPAAKVSKEDLISWITYAMRLMASKINITLATAEHDDSLPRENIEKLRNSSLLLNHFIDDLKEETKRFNATKSLMSAGFKNQDVRSMMRDKGLDQQTRASNVEQTTQYAKSQNFDFFTNRPVDIQNIVRPPDPLGSLNLVQIRNHIAYPPRATPPAINEAATNAMTTMMAAGEGGTISVPFEAYVTITRDGATLVQPTTTDTGTTTKMPRQQQQQQQQQQQSQMQKKNKKKTQLGSKGSHGASSEQVPDKVTSPGRGKKKNNYNKTEVLFEGDSTTAKSSDKNKNKKKKATTKRPSLLSMFMNRGKKKKPQKQSDDDEDFADEDANNDFGGQANQDEYADDDNGGGVGGGVGGGDDDSGFRDDYEYDEDEGSLGSIEDLIPLVIPILEDISDPESETDITDVLIAAVPLLQGISAIDPETGEGPDIVGTLLPVFQAVSVGKDGMGSDSGAFLGPLIQLLGPFIGPLFGPLVGPLSSSLSGNGPNGIALGKILGSLFRTSAEEMDGMSIITNVVSSILPILSKELSGPDSDIDFGKIVSQVVVGASSGLSTGLSGGSSTGGDHPGYAYGPPAPAYGAPPASPAQANFANFLNPPPPGRPASFQAPSKRPSPSSTGVKKPNKSSFFRPQATQYRPQATHAETPAESNQKNKHKPPATNYSYNNNNNYHNSYQPPNRYPTHHDSYESAEDHHYGAYGPPRVNPFDLLGKSIKELLSGSINLFSAILSTSTASAGGFSQQSAAGSASGSSSPPAMQGYGYGPPATHYGAPTINNQNYQTPQKFG